MVICNIVTDKSDIGDLKFPSFVNVCDKHWKIEDKLPTLLYGYQMAKELFPNDLDLNHRYLRQKIKWSHTMTEMKEECWVTDFVKESVEDLLKCRAVSHDVIFDTNFNIDSFVARLSEFPIVHAGAHEIYVGEKRYDDELIVHSFQMDNLKYTGIDPEKFFYQLINKLESKCVVFSLDEIEVRQFPTPPISFQDLIQASRNEMLTFKNVITTFRPWVDEFKKEMLLSYFLRHKLYSPTMFKNFI